MVNVNPKALKSFRLKVEVLVFCDDGFEQLCSDITFYFLMRILSVILLCLSLISIESKSQLRPATTTATKKSTTAVSSKQITPPKMELPSSVKLLIGAGGIYGAFLYYGTLQEDVFHYKAADGSKFKSAWFLQALGK